LEALDKAQFRELKLETSLSV